MLFSRWRNPSVAYRAYAVGLPPARKSAGVESVGSMLPRANHRGGFPGVVGMDYWPFPNSGATARLQVRDRPTGNGRCADAQVIRTG